MQKRVLLEQGARRNFRGVSGPSLPYLIISWKFHLLGGVVKIFLSDRLRGAATARTRLHTSAEARFLDLGSPARPTNRYGSVLTVVNGVEQRVSRVRAAVRADHPSEDCNNPSR